MREEGATARLLMCPPTGAAGRAAEEWERLRVTLEGLGAEVELAPAGHAFASAAGFALADRAVAAGAGHPGRRDEEDAHAAWLACAGYAVTRCSWPFAGAADLCGAGDALLGGHGLDTDRRALDEAAAWLGVDVVPVELVDPWLGHLDLVVAPLGGAGALVAPRGLSRHGARAVAAHFEDPVELTPDETEDLAANCLVVGGAVVLHRCSARLGRELAARGLEPIECPVGEFARAGGAVRSLAVRLDGGPAAPAAPRSAALAGALG